MKAKYDWRAADDALSMATAALFTARRHLAHGKRANIIRDVADVERELVRVRGALRLGSSHEEA